MKRLTLLVLLLGLDCAHAVQAAGGAMPPPPPPRFTADIAAINHLLAPVLSQKTGRSVGEITALLREQGPPEAARQLGLDPEEMHELMRTACEAMIQKALAAGLIDAEDVKRIEQARAERDARMPPRGEGDGESAAQPRSRR